MTFQKFADEYDQILNSTLNEWGLNHSIGEIENEFPEVFSKYGLSIGSFLPPIPQLNPILEHLEKIAQFDPLHVNVAKRFLHFTFLAITKQIYASISEFPYDYCDIKTLANTHLTNAPWTLSDLRLIPGPNFLLLVGIPSRGVQTARENLAKDLMKTSWKPNIEARYFPKFNFPPNIWHTTLCRHRAQYFPQETRKVILEHIHSRFGALVLPNPTLKIINFDWSSSLHIE